MVLYADIYGMASSMTYHNPLLFRVTPFNMSVVTV